MEIIEAEACTIVDESFVKQARELLDREERSEMAKMLRIILDHYEKTSGKVIHIFEFSKHIHKIFSVQESTTGRLDYSKLPSNRRIEEVKLSKSFAKGLDNHFISFSSR